MLYEVITEIIQEMLLTKTSERQGRLIDHDQAGSIVITSYSIHYTKLYECQG